MVQIFDGIEAALKAVRRSLSFRLLTIPTGLVSQSAKSPQFQPLRGRHIVWRHRRSTVALRLLYSGQVLCVFRACDTQPESVLTIIGPSKTESLSGFRLGTGVGSSRLIDEMERLQAIQPTGGGCNESGAWYLVVGTCRLDGNVFVNMKRLMKNYWKFFQAARFSRQQLRKPGTIFPRQAAALDVEPYTFVRLLHHQAGVTVTPGTNYYRFKWRRPAKLFTGPRWTITATVRIVKIVKVLPLNRPRIVNNLSHKVSLCTYSWAHETWFILQGMTLWESQNYLFWLK